MNAYFQHLLYYTHANKKKATQIHRLYWNYVMITNLYIVSHILYDRHLYNYILWAFCAWSEEAWVYIWTRPLWNAFPLLNQLAFQLFG